MAPLLIMAHDGQNGNLALISQEQALVRPRIEPTGMMIGFLIRCRDQK
jgi:hypothetical protein